MSESDEPAHNHEYLPPPIGVHHEQPRTTTEALKLTIEEDPDYARWVLFRSEGVMALLDEWFSSGTNPRDTNIKEKVAELLLEARELELAILQNRELQKLFEQPAIDEA